MPVRYHFGIFLALSGMLMAQGAEPSQKKTPATNNPAWTGEREEKTEPSIPATNNVTPSASTKVPSGPPSPAPVPEGRVATLAVTDLKEYAGQSAAVQRMIAQGLALTTLGLTYQYGSADPKNGGMDCSGTIHYLLIQEGLKDAPRDASELYKWVWKESRFYSVVSSHADTFELDHLKPGDLLFWTGTYHVDHDPPVTHVMLYLGTDRNGHRVMMGASEGRPFDGKSRYGVSVFDFKIPGRKPSPASTGTAETGLESQFIGYGSVPGLETASPDESK